MRHIIITFDGRTADESLCSNAVFAVFFCVARRFLALHGGFPTYIRALRMINFI